MHAASCPGPTPALLSLYIATRPLLLNKCLNPDVPFFCFFLERQFCLQVHLLEFGYVRNMDNLFRRLVGEPRQFYEIRIPRGRPKEEKTSAVVQTLNRLNPGE